MLGRLMDRRGPRIVIETGVGLVAIGLILASMIREPPAGPFVLLDQESPR